MVNRIAVFGGAALIAASFTIVPDGGGGTIFDTKATIETELSKSWAPESLGDWGKGATFYGGLILIILGLFVL